MSFDAILEFRRGERVSFPRRKCCECGQARPDVDLFAEDSETGESIYMCGECVGKEYMAGHIEDGMEVECLVIFDGKKTPACLPTSWFCTMTYGTLLKDGRVWWGDREVYPPSYEKV